MKKVPKNFKNVIQNLAEEKFSQCVFIKDENESVSVSVIQIGDKIKVVSPPVLSKIQQKAVNALTQYLKKQNRIHNEDMNTSGTC